MYKRRGFTLIELLVVIAIIALLMAILMPALARVRRQAKGVSCQVQLRQWGLCFSMYADTNEHQFPAGNPGGTNPALSWIYALQPYYKDGMLKMCPLATKPYEGDETSPILAYGPLWGSDPLDVGPRTDDGNPWFVMFPPENYGFSYTDEDRYVSYAQNDWARSVLGDGARASRRWKGPNVKGAAKVPLMTDCKNFYVVEPSDDHGPPEVEGEGGSWEEPMKWLCIDRHRMTINGVFFDWAVRRIELKCLWTFKWHREFNNVDGTWVSIGTPGTPGYYVPPWPPWMRKLPECE